MDTQKLDIYYLIFSPTRYDLPNHGKISVSVSAPSSKRLVFRVSDTSPGLNAKKSTEFFQPFALNELQYF